MHITWTTSFIFISPILAFWLLVDIPIDSPTLYINYTIFRAKKKEFKNEYKRIKKAMKQSSVEILANEISEEKENLQNEIEDKNINKQND